MFAADDFFILHTGVPGSGKTNSAVDTIENTKEYRDATVYAHAIDEWQRAVPISCSNPACRSCRKLTAEQKASMPKIEEWYVWSTAGSIILIDEAHYPFPQRREQEAPMFIKRMTEHRHDGVVFICCTPNANYMDINVRRLVQRHVHFVNGMTGRFTYTHTEVMASDAALKMGVKERFSLKKRSFGVYKSADAHVKLKRPVPRFIIWFGVGVAVFAVSLVGVVVMLKKSRSDLRSEPAGVTAPVVGAEPARVEASVSPAVNRTGVVSGSVPGPMPVAPVQRSVAVESVAIAGCVSNPLKCYCYDDTGARVRSSERRCLKVVSGELRVEDF